MKRAKIVQVLRLVCVGVLISTGVARADGGGVPGCQTVSGQIFELEVPANEVNNPINHGRVVAVVTGALNGAETAILTGPGVPPAAPPPGFFAAVATQNVFVSKDGDMLVTKGNAILSFNSDGTVADDLTLTVQGASSTGKFAGTTGTIHLVGTGFNFGGGPGVGRFEFRYSGQICGIHDNE